MSGRVSELSCTSASIDYSEIWLIKLGSGMMQKAFKKVVKVQVKYESDHQVNEVVSKSETHN
jgi:hypothetical protein